MNKPQLSIRLASPERQLLNKTIVRITINPVILLLLNSYLEKKEQTLSSIVGNAHKRFPKLPLSWAIEGYLALLLDSQSSMMKPFSLEPLKSLDKNVLFFMSLSPAAKIRVGERWKKELEQLRATE